MNKVTYIPGEIANAAIDEHGNRKPVTRTQYIFDDNLEKPQSEVNQDRIEDIAAEVQRAQSAESTLDGKIGTEKTRAEGVEGGLNTRLQTVEQLAEISIGGGDAQIATGADFINPDATKRAKVPTVGAIIDGLNDGVYDVSKRNPTAGSNSDGKFTLEYILSNANTLIPTGWRHGGMTISFVQNSNNKYVQYQYMDTEITGNPNPFLDVANWQKQGGEVSVVQNTNTGGHNLYIGEVKKASVDGFFNINIYKDNASPYESAPYARHQVPSNMRALGLTIKYLLSDGWHIEEFCGSAIDENWGVDSNWKGSVYQYVQANCKKQITSTNVVKVNDYSVSITFIRVKDLDGNNVLVYADTVNHTAKTFDLSVNQYLVLTGNNQIIQRESQLDVLLTDCVLLTFNNSVNAFGGGVLLPLLNNSRLNSIENTVSGLTDNVNGLLPEVDVLSKSMNGITYTEEIDDYSLLDGTYVNVSSAKILSSETRKSVYWPCKPDVSYVITKSLGSVFRLGTCVTIPAVNVDVISPANIDTKNEVVINTSSNSKYIVVTYYDSTVDTDSASDILNSITVAEIQAKDLYAREQIDIESDEISDINVVLGQLVDKEDITEDSTDLNNAYINLSRSEIMFSSDRKIVYWKCKPNSIYNISKTLGVTFRVGFTETTPAVDVSVLDAVNYEGKTEAQLISPSTAEYLAIYYYNSASDTDSASDILASITIEAISPKNTGSFATTKYYRDKAFFAKNTANIWFNQALIDTLNVFDTDTTVAEYHAALQSLFNTYASLGLSYENLGKDASNTYDLFGYHINIDINQHTVLSIDNVEIDAPKVKPTVIIIGCQHGFEKGGAFSLYHFVKYICENWKTDPVIGNLAINYKWEFIPIVNPYGWSIYVPAHDIATTTGRYNANNKDLNRDYNVPYENLEPEQKIVYDWVQRFKSNAVLFMDVHTNGSTRVYDTIATKQWNSLWAYTAKESHLERVCWNWQSYISYWLSAKYWNTPTRCNDISYGTYISAKWLGDVNGIPSLTHECAVKMLNTDAEEYMPDVISYNATTFINFLNQALGYYTELYNSLE